MDAPMTLWVRDNPISSAENSANNVKNTFSSWDNCMQKDYCKYPVIIVIVIVSLIVLSIVWCLVRCLCCGLECCCGCFRCFNECCSCCQPRGRRRGGYDDDYNRGGASGYGGGGPGFGNTGYQAPPPAPIYVNVTAPAQRYEPSRQYASFDQPSKRAAPSYGNEDSLPAMPSWQDGHTKQIETEEEAVEMDHLDHYQSQKAPMLNNQAGVPRSTPTPGAQTPGGGLYADEPVHHEMDSGDLGDGYGQHHDAYAGAAGALGGAAVGAAAGAGMAHYGQQHHDPYGQQQQQQQYGYGAPQQTGVTGYGPSPPPQQHGYVSPPPHHGYVSPPPQSNFTSPPPPSYHTRAISPETPAAPAGLPSSLTPGGGSTPAPTGQQSSSYQPYGGQQSGVTGGQSYSAYQPQGQAPHGTWHDV